MEWNERVRLLAEAGEHLRRRVPDCYDEPLREVADRAAASGSLGKADLGALVLWKRLRADTRWAVDLLRTPDRDVRGYTGAAARAVWGEEDVVAAARAGRAALAPLPGFGGGDALASVALVAVDLARLPVYDRHSHAALGLLGLSLTHPPGRYARYVDLIERCRAELRGHDLDWTARQVDLALFELGRGSTPRAGARPGGGSA